MATGPHRRAASTAEGTVDRHMEFLQQSFGQLFSVGTLAAMVRAAVRIVVVVALARLALAVSRRVIDRVFKYTPGMTKWRDWDEQRAKTVSSLVKSVAHYTIFFVAGVMVLDSIGINTGSLLAAAGIAGLAVGFGAQNLVKDVVSGFFILFENQFQVGDYVTVAGVSGFVEHTGLRTTWIRGFGGEMQIVPNGEMRKVTNHMGPKMRVLVHVAIAHDEDVDRATQVLAEAFERARAGGKLADIVEGPKVLGVSDLGDAGVELLLWARAKTMQQFAMTRELRLVAKQALDAEGIRSGYVRRHIILDGAADGRDPDPLRPVAAGAEAHAPGTGAQDAAARHAEARQTEAEQLIEDGQADGPGDGAGR